MNECRSCGAPLRWAVTEANGRRIPLDPEPVDRGNIELVGGMAIYVTPDDEVKRYVSHFVTCPNATKHRKQRRVSP